MKYDPKREAVFVKSDRRNAESSVYYWRNTAGERAQSWQRFDLLITAHHELSRALLGIDPPEAWGGRNARIRRFFEAVRELPKPRLP